MDGAGGRPGGEILALTEKLEDPDFCRALEFDLIDLGLRLRWLCDGTDRLNWRDLLVIVRESGRESAITRFELGEAAEWSIDTHLLANINHVLDWANWQRGGGKGGKPKPIEPPQIRTDGGTESSMFGSDFEKDDMSLDEVREFLGIAE